MDDGRIILVLWKANQHRLSGAFEVNAQKEIFVTLVCLWIWASIIHSAPFIRFNLKMCTLSQELKDVIFFSLKTDRSYGID